MFKRTKIPLGLVVIVLLQCAVYARTANDTSAFVYVGTFTDTAAKSEGIYSFQVQTGASNNVTLSPLVLAAKTPSPSFLALDAKRHLLFSANEIDSFDGKPGGAVSAFSIDPARGKLTFINSRSSMGSRPCHLVLDKTGRNVLVANYNSGTVAVLPIGTDGELGEATCVFQDVGKGPNAARQAGPHAHCVAVSPDNRFVFVCDLGIDKVMIFKFDAQHGKLIPNNPPFAQIKPGSGPRHLVFHPNGKFAYLISEMASTLTVFDYDPATGALNEIQTLSSLSPDFHDSNTAAEVAIEPTGRFLFASNRGQNSISVFAINSKTGMLQWIGEQSTEGKTPRQFGITPSGMEMLICNQDSDSIIPCRIDPVTGQLTRSGNVLACPSPVCAVFSAAEHAQAR